MKNLFTLILLFCTTILFSQKNKRITYSEDSEINVVYNEIANTNLAEIVVNDVFVGLAEGKTSFATFNVDNIENIKIVKKKPNVKDYAGGIFITLKSYYTPKFITIKKLIDKYLNIDDNPIIFQVDENIINQDYDKFKVDENFILKIKLTKIKTSKETNINLVKLITKTEENIKKANVVMIRGESY